MLKLTYTDVQLTLERLSGSIETLVAQRVVLALRVGQSIHVEPGKAAFLLPMGVVNLKEFKAAVRSEGSNAIALCAVDEDFLEVSLKGTWIAGHCDAHEGMFIAGLSDRTEFFVHKLWQATQTAASVIS
jgi:hypothetical protein